jgi:hypothetical protein
MKRDYTFQLYQNGKPLTTYVIEAATRQEAENGMKDRIRRMEQLARDMAILAAKQIKLDAKLLFDSDG